MPFLLRKVRNQPYYSVKNAITKQIHSFHATKANAKAQIRLLHAIDHGFVPTKRIIKGGMDCFGMNCFRRRRRIGQIAPDNSIPNNPNPMQFIPINRTPEVPYTNIISPEELFGPSIRSNKIADVSHIRGRK